MASRSLGLPAQAIEAVRDNFLETGGGTLTTREARELANDLIDRQALTPDAAAQIMSWLAAKG